MHWPLTSQRVAPPRRWAPVRSMQTKVVQACVASILGMHVGPCGAQRPCSSTRSALCASHRLLHAIEPRLQTVVKTGCRGPCLPLAPRLRRHSHGHLKCIGGAAWQLPARLLSNRGATNATCSAAGPESRLPCASCMLPGLCHTMSTCTFWPHDNGRPPPTCPQRCCTHERSVANRSLWRAEEQCRRP